MNRIILVTGSTSGIGKYVAKRLLEQGDTVIVTSSTNEKIERTKNDFYAFKNVFFLQANLQEENSTNELFRRIENKYGYLDILVNNAAFDSMSSLENYDYNTFCRIVKTNLIGKAFCIKKAIKLLKKSNYPSIINISSRLAEKPMKNSTAYCCSAAGIVMLTKCMALELEDFNIRVNCISPSLTLTPLAKQSYSSNEIKEVEQKSLRHRICEMEDIYNVLDFLISKKSDYINGENINVNGGILLK